MRFGWPHFRILVLKVLVVGTIAVYMYGKMLCTYQGLFIMERYGGLFNDLHCRLSER